MLFRWWQIRWNRFRFSSDYESYKKSWFNSNWKRTICRKLFPWISPFWVKSPILILCIFSSYSVYGLCYTICCVISFWGEGSCFCHSKHPQRPLHTTTYLSTQILSSPMSRACQYWSSLLIYWKFPIATASLVVDAG